MSDAERHRPWTVWAVGMVVGVAIGIAIGAAMGMIGAGIAIGAGIGLALAIGLGEYDRARRRRGGSRDGQTPER